MTILIANIGTSDLAVKIQQPLKNFKERLSQSQNENLITQLNKLTDDELKKDYYLPIGFDRKEPNLKIKSIEDSEEKIEPEDILWTYRQQIIAEELCKKWNIEFDKYFSFRDFTECLLAKYIKNPDLWHERICPSRILGVIEEAKKQSVSKIYLFFTDQNTKNTNDTIYLCDIIKLWLSKELDFKNIDLVPYNINQNGISAVDFDGLLSQYYQFFVERNKEKIDKLLISVKGGTPQMQTTLRIQVSSSGIANQIYLEPQLSIKKLLAGEASECNKVSYWQYQRIQKYQTVKKLLNRWDFDGARTILEEWSTPLEQLEKDGITEVAKSRDLVELAMKATEVAVAYLNLDGEEADNQSDRGLKLFERLPQIDPDIASNLDDYPFHLVSTYDSNLNLFSQCCLFWELDRISHFLSGMSTFYEETLHALIQQNREMVQKYFDKNKDPNDWWLKTTTLFLENRVLAEHFFELEISSKNWKLKNFLNKKGCVDKNKWVKTIDIKKSNDLFQLPGRPTKLNFVRALIEIDGSSEQQLIFNKMMNVMRSLDYWAEKRNQLIHSAKGISKQRMEEELDCDRKNSNKKNLDRVCPHDKILEQMLIIVHSFLQLTDGDISAPFESVNEPHYLYSDIRRWVIETLDRDR